MSTHRMRGAGEPMSVATVIVLVLGLALPASAERRPPKAPVNGTSHRAVADSTLAARERTRADWAETGRLMGLHHRCYK